MLYDWTFWAIAGISSSPFDPPLSSLASPSPASSSPSSSPFNALRVKRRPMAASTKMYAIPTTASAIPSASSPNTSRLPPSIPRAIPTNISAPSR